MVKNFGSLVQQVQIVKDSYYKLIKNASAGMSHEYQLISGKVDDALRLLKNYPVELNIQNDRKLDELKRYCKDRIIEEPVLEYSLSDMLNYTALSPTKNNELLIIQSSFISEAPKEVTESGVGDDSQIHKNPRKVQFQIASRIMTVQEYKSLLTAQLSLLASAKPEEEIELDIEIL